MSLLDRIHEANRHDLSGFRPLRIAGQVVGAVRHRFAERLRDWPAVFRVQPEGVRLSPELDDAGASCEQRTDAVAGVCAALRDDGTIGGWRHELYPVAIGWRDPPLLLLDEVAVGDYVLVHVGYALNVLDAGEAEATLKLMREAGISA